MCCRDFPFDVSAEVRHAVEVHLCRHLFCRELPMPKQVMNLHHGELLNPIARGTTAHLGRDSVQVLGRHAELFCVVGNGPVLTIAPSLQHADEARHDVGCPLCHLFVLEECGMGIHGIKIKYAHALQDCLLTIGLWGVLGAESNVLEVAPKNGKHVAFELEDGVHEQMQPATSAVTAVRHAGHLLLGRQQELAELAILRRLDAPHMACHHYHAAAWPEGLLVPGEVKPTGAGRTEKVKNLLLHATY